MKRLHLALVACLLMLSATVASAQDQPPRMGGGRMLGILLQGITLTAEQQARVDTISAKYSEQMRAAMMDESGDQQARRTKMREMMTKQTDEIKAVLTDEQKKVLEKNLADMEARRAQMQGQRPPRK